MANEKFIALEETSQEIKTTVNDVKTNVDGLKNTDVPGIDTIVNAVLERIGLTSDTGGSGTLGTVMAKLNYLINRLSSNSNPAIKSIQSNIFSGRGYYNSDLPIKVTLPKAVDKSKSFVMVMGTDIVSSENADTGSYPKDYYHPQAELISNTQIALYRTQYYRSGSNSMYSVDIRWQVIEFY